MIKKLAIMLIKIFKSLFYIFPIKSQALIFCYDGKKLVDNSRCVYCALEQKAITAYFAGKKHMADDGIKFVRINSIKFVYLMATSKFIITNMNIKKPYASKRRGQIFINTWHGSGGLKGNINTANVNYNLYDFWIVESKFDEAIFRDPNEFNFKNNFLRFGMPRNDILVKNDKNRALEIKQVNGFSQDEMLILYAPTMRESSVAHYIDDFNEIIQRVEARFKRKVKVLIRYHHFQKYSGIHFNDDIIDFSEYDDMQELLLISDILITDYSSCAWDFSLMYKPVYLYIADYIEYVEKRGKPFADYSKLPFFKSKNLDELCGQLSNGDYEQYIKNLKSYHNAMERYNYDGQATEKLVKFIEENL